MYTCIIERKCIPMSESTLENQQLENQKPTTFSSYKLKSPIALVIRTPQLLLDDLLQMYLHRKTSHSSTCLVRCFSDADPDRRRLSARRRSGSEESFAVATPGSKHRKSCSDLKLETKELENEVNFLEKFIKTLHDLRSNTQQSEMKGNWHRREKCCSAPELSVRKSYIRKSYIQEEDNLTLYGHSLLPPSRPKSFPNEAQMNLKTYLKHPKRRSSNRTECRRGSINKDTKNEELQLCVEGNQIQKLIMKTKEPNSKYIFLSATSKMSTKNKRK